MKSFCSIPKILLLLKDYIVFAEKDEELNKYILRQHQTGASTAADVGCRYSEPALSFTVTVPGSPTFQSNRSAKGP